MKKPIQLIVGLLTAFMSSAFSDSLVLTNERDSLVSACLGRGITGSIVGIKDNFMQFEIAFGNCNIGELSPNCKSLFEEASLRTSKKYPLMPSSNILQFLVPMQDVKKVTLNENLSRQCESEEPNSPSFFNQYGWDQLYRPAGVISTPPVTNGIWTAFAQMWVDSSVYDTFNPNSLWAPRNVQQQSVTQFVVDNEPTQAWMDAEFDTGAVAVKQLGFYAALPNVMDRHGNGIVVDDLITINYENPSWNELLNSGIGVGKKIPMKILGDYESTFDSLQSMKGIAITLQEKKPNGLIDVYTIWPKDISPESHLEGSDNANEFLLDISMIEKIPSIMTGVLGVSLYYQSKIEIEDGNVGDNTWIVESTKDSRTVAGEMIDVYFKSGIRTFKIRTEPESVTEDYSDYTPSSIRRLAE